MDYGVSSYILIRDLKKTRGWSYSVKNTYKYLFVPYRSICLLCMDGYNSYKWCYVCPWFFLCQQLDGVSGVLGNSLHRFIGNTNYFDWLWLVLLIKEKFLISYHQICAFYEVNYFLYEVNYFISGSCVSFNIGGWKRI